MLVCRVSESLNLIENYSTTRASHVANRFTSFSHDLGVFTALPVMYYVVKETAKSHDMWTRIREVPGEEEM